MGFGDRWIMWMEACVFNNFMSVLVNGSIAEDFKVERGSRQRDQLSPFLFVMDMEGLTSLMDSTVDLGECNIFKINEEVSVDIP